MFEKISRSIYMGLGIGSIVTTACLWILNGRDDTIVQVATWLVASALYGLLSMVFEMDSLTLSTLIHSIGCIAITLTTGYILGYGNNLAQLAKGVLPIFLIIYVVIYLLSFLSAYHKARQINKKLNHTN